MRPEDLDLWLATIRQPCPSTEPGRSEWINAYEHIQALTVQGKLRERPTPDEEGGDPSVHN